MIQTLIAFDSELWERLKREKRERRVHYAWIVRQALRKHFGIEADEKPRRMPENSK